jgi:hypothetical protein
MNCISGTCFPEENFSFEAALGADLATLSVEEQKNLIELDPNCFFRNLLPASLAQFTFHVIANECLLQVRSEDLVRKSEGIEVLELEPLDIRQNPEKAAWAVQNRALMALRNQGQPDGDVHIEIRAFPLFAELVEKGRIRQLHMKNRDGLMERALKREDVEISHFSAQEAHQAAFALFRSVDLSFKIRQVQETIKLQELQGRKEEEELAVKDRFCLQELLLQRLAKWAAYAGKEQASKLCCRNGSFLSLLFDSIVLDFIRKERAEKRREEKKAAAAEALRADILRGEIQHSDQNRERTHRHWRLFEQVSFGK